MSKEYNDRVAELEARDPATLTEEEKLFLFAASMTLMDDVFMTQVFNGDCEGVAFVLNAIFGRDDMIRHGSGNTERIQQSRIPQYPA